MNRTQQVDGCCTTRITPAHTAAIDSALQSRRAVPQRLWDRASPAEDAFVLQGGLPVGRPRMRLLA